MNISRITVITTIISIILLLTVPTFYKIIKNHNDNLYRVVEGKIISRAEQCFYDEKCSENEITLKELYEKDYLEEISNPVTKEYYNENSYVLRNKTDFKFIEVE